MSPETLLGVYHFCSLAHTGQASREYRVLSRVLRRFTPSPSEQHFDILEKPGYERALDVFESLSKSW